METNFATLVAQKEIRDKRRYTQKEIAEFAGVSEAMVSRWMRGIGISNARMDNVVKMCVWLDCEIGEFVRIVRNGEG